MEKYNSNNKSVLTCKHASNIFPTQEEMLGKARFIAATVRTYTVAI